MGECGAIQIWNSVAGLLVDRIHIMQLIVLCMEAALYGRPKTLAYNPRGVTKSATTFQPHDRLMG